MTSLTAGAVIVSPAKFFLLRSSNSPRSSAPSNRVPFCHRAFKSHTVPSRPTDSISSDTPERSGVSRPHRSVSVSSESIQQTSLSVTRQPISVPETSTSPKYLPHRSVDFNSDQQRVDILYLYSGFENVH